jgi:hypothetical protein
VTRNAQLQVEIDKGVLVSTTLQFDGLLFNRSLLENINSKFEVIRLASRVDRLSEN